MIYGRVSGAMLVAMLLRISINTLFPAETLQAEIHGIGAYVGVLGALYSIIVAFMIYVVWDQFNRVQTGVAQEASALEDLCRAAGFLSDRHTVSIVRATTRRYIESTSGDETRRLAQGQFSTLAEEQFDALCQVVRGVEVKTEKDEAVYSELLRALSRVSDARDERLSVSMTRIPHTLWSLVVFASCALFGGFLVLGIRSLPLSLAVVAAMAGSLTFLLSVIKDMDNPFTGVWNVSYASMANVIARIGLK
jgi:hypothetical protein